MKVLMNRVRATARGFLLESACVCPRRPLRQNLPKLIRKTWRLAAEIPETRSKPESGSRNAHRGGN